jgi:hypothetical protein
MDVRACKKILFIQMQRIFFPKSVCYSREMCVESKGSYIYAIATKNA